MQYTAKDPNILFTGSHELLPFLVVKGKALHLLDLHKTNSLIHFLQKNGRGQA